MKHTLSETFQIIIVLSIGSLSLLAIFLAMLSKPYPFQADLQTFPYAMMGIILVFMGMFGVLNILCWRDEE